MYKYISWFGLIPVSIILMGFITEDDLCKHTEKVCFGLLLSLIVFTILYFMLLHLKVKKYIALSIATSLWIIAFVIRRKIYG